MEGYTLIDVVCQIEIYIVKIFAQDIRSLEDSA